MFGNETIKCEKCVSKIEINTKKVKAKESMTVQRYIETKTSP